MVMSTTSAWPEGPLQGTGEKGPASVDDAKDQAIIYIYPATIRCQRSKFGEKATKVRFAFS